MALTKVQKTGITDNAIDADKIEDGTIVAADIAPGTITDAKLNSTLDLSSKTVTLPNTSVTNAQLAGSIANDKLANSSITVNGSSVSLGGSVSAGKVSWQTVKTADFNAVAGEGYFVDTNSVGAVTATLPASPSAGDTIAFKDYATNFATNSLTLARNGNNIQGIANDSEITTNRASVVLVYIDATKGWLYTNESNVADLQEATYISATGGTVVTSGDYKTHIFTGDGCFVVSTIGNPAGGPSVVDYVIVAGGGDGTVGGGGGGGFRTSNCSSRSGIPTLSPLDTSTGITVTSTTYPVTVGAAGDANPSNFSTITSAGGGRGPHYVSNPLNGAPGGSGGGGAGAGACRGTAGSGNSPPVSPPPGQPGGNASGPNYPTPIHGGAGGGATGAGTPGGSGTGGDGAPVATTFFGPVSGCYGTPGPAPGRWFSGGGGTGSTPATLNNGGKGGGGHGGGSNATGGFFAGTINTGGGGGGST